MRAALLTLSLVACSGSSPLVSSANPDAGSGGSPLANGTCAIKIDGVELELPGYAHMNGSGNLWIRCATMATSLKLDVGNGTYLGPNEYAFSPELNNGDLEITTSERVYDATTGKNVNTACIVKVDDAPPTHTPPVGSPIGGSFKCTAVPYFKLTDAGRSSMQDGTADLHGAFNVAIR